MSVGKAMKLAVLVGLVASLLMSENALARWPRWRRPSSPPRAQPQAGNVAPSPAPAGPADKAPPVQTYRVHAARILLPPGSTYKRLSSGSIVVYDKKSGGTAQVDCTCTAGGTCEKTATSGVGGTQTVYTCTPASGCSGCTMTITTSNPKVLGAFRDALTKRPIKLALIKTPPAKAPPTEAPPTEVAK